MTKTANYQLNQWEPTDALSRADFNADNAAIDAAIKAVADTAAGKANAEEVTALSQNVAALSTALGSGGHNCRIAYGNYTGTGKAGSGNPNRLTFDFKPLVVWVYTADYESFATLLTGQKESYFEDGASCTVSWSGNTVSWYNTDGAGGQFNDSGSKYLYICIGS